VKANQQIANQIVEVARFCIEHQGRCWKGWSANKIFRYLSFHFLAGTLGVTRANNTIVGVGIAWPDSSTEILRRDKDKELQFNWRLPEKGDALMIAEVFGARSVCGKLWIVALSRWPRIQRIFTHRQKRNDAEPMLVELNIKTVLRMTKGLYGRA
jgi:hypothetical protein